MMNLWLTGFITVILLFQIVSIPALILKKNDLADVLWGPAFVLTALNALIWSSNANDVPGMINGVFLTLSTRSLLMLCLLAVWALRLFIHVGLRNLSHRTEDVRYNNWRKAWGKHWFLRSYLQVFVLQAFILYVFLTPVLLSLDNPNTSSHSFLTWINGLGLVVAILGFLLESIADEQLRQFKIDPINKGKLMTKGLWSWSRHPNYFGEVLLWWGIWLMVVDLPWGWATIVSPIGVTYLILKVSGVSMLEDLMKSRMGYAEYAARTSIFIPMPPKKLNK